MEDKLNWHVLLFLYYNKKQVGFMLPCVCLVCGKNISDTIGYRPRRVPLFCSYYILTSSVIYYWTATDARQNIHNNIFIACSTRGCRGSCPFRRRSMPFSGHLKIFFTINKIFSSKSVSNHPVSNPEPLLLNIPLIPLHCQVDPPA